MKSHWTHGRMDMANRNYLAIDIGASSGRHVIGRFDGQRLALEEIHRFENGPVDLGGSLYWDLPRLWQEIVAGLQIAGKAECRGAPLIGEQEQDVGLTGGNSGSRQQSSQDRGDATGDHTRVQTDPVTASRIPFARSDSCFSPGFIHAFTRRRSLFS